MVQQIPTKFFFLIFRYSSGVELKAKAKAKGKPNLDSALLLYVPQRKATYVFNNSEINLFFQCRGKDNSLFYFCFLNLFSYHSSCRKDQFIALISKFGIEYFTEHR